MTAYDRRLLAGMHIACEDEQPELDAPEPARFPWIIEPRGKLTSFAVWVFSGAYWAEERWQGRV